MAAPTVLRSGIVAILQAVEDRLVARSAIGHATEIKWIVGDGRSVPKLDSDYDLLLWARGFTAPPIQSWQTGAGRAGVKLTRRLDIVPRTRLALDAPDRRKVWLVGATGDPGYFPTEEAVIDALVLWTPLDASGNHLTACDLHLLAGADPAKDSGAWGWGSVSFEIQYLLSLTQGYT